MPLFGEIVIPSTRALWDEDYDLLQEERTAVNLEWDHAVSLKNVKFDNLIIVETNKLTQLAKTCLLPSNAKPVAKVLGINLNVYRMNNNCIILVNEVEDIAAGEIVEKLTPLITAAGSIVAFTSAPAATYQTLISDEKPSCFVRSLKTGDVKMLFAPMLEAPNLVTGITSGVVSYCHFVGRSASLYTCYLEPRPLDSISAEPILKIFRNLKIPIMNEFKVKMSASDSNLYM